MVEREWARMERGILISLTIPSNLFNTVLIFLEIILSVYNPFYIFNILFIRSIVNVHNLCGCHGTQWPRQLHNL